MQSSCGLLYLVVFTCSVNSSIFDFDMAKDLPDIPPVDPRIWKLESEMRGLGECLLCMASLAGRLSFGRSYLRYGSQLI